MQKVLGSMPTRVASRKGHEHDGQERAAREMRETEAIIGLMRGKRQEGVVIGTALQTSVRKTGRSAHSGCQYGLLNCSRK
jgi:hypothetical protein